MRKIFEWVGGFALIAFSFYFTDRVSLMVANKSELMQSIKAVSSTYKTTPVDAIIDNENNSIIPGKYGKIVNDQESYLNMHDFGSFNENYLIFDFVKPETSLNDNKDKFISSGNPSNRNVSLIINNNPETANFLNSSKIQYNIVTNKQGTKEEYAEIINTATDKNEFYAIGKTLSENKKICLKGVSDLDLCKKNSYYLIDPILELDNNNYVEIKNGLNPGSIIKIGPNTKVENVKLLLSEIKYKDFNIVHISKLIDEKEG